jgi:hypothetical protein
MKPVISRFRGGLHPDLFTCFSSCIYGTLSLKNLKYTNKLTQLIAVKWVSTGAEINAPWRQSCFCFLSSTQDSAWHRVDKDRVTICSEWKNSSFWRNRWSSNCQPPWNHSHLETTAIKEQCDGNFQKVMRKQRQEKLKIMTTTFCG